MKKSFHYANRRAIFHSWRKTGCLLLHGFTGTPKEMRMLGDSLASDGHTVLAPRLFGHATDPEDYAAGTLAGLGCLRRGRLPYFERLHRKAICHGAFHGRGINIDRRLPATFCRCSNFSALSTCQKIPPRIATAAWSSQPSQQQGKIRLA